MSLWDWTDIQNLAFDYRTTVVRLSPYSLAILLSTEDLTEIRSWSVSGDSPTSSEADQIEAATAQMYFELSGSLMLGTIFPFAVGVPPDGSLECDGTTYLRVDYPALYAALDSAFIVDADHFRTPDLRGRVVIGEGHGTGLSSYVMGDTGGEEAHTLLTAELAAHSHTTVPHSHTDVGHVHSEIPALPNVTTIGPGAPQPTAIPGVAVTGVGFANLTTDGVTVNSEGADTPHENRQPYFVLRYAIWTM